MTTEEVSDYLRIDRMTIYKLARRRVLPAVKVGRHWRFPRHLIDEWLRDHSLQQKRRILVVDDEAIICDLVSEILGAEGYDVVAVQDGGEALQWLGRQRFDLAFLDLMMTPLNGVEVFQHLREVDPELPVIIITGYPDSDLMVRAMDKGPFAILKKPFGKSQIVNAVKTFLHSRAPDSAVAR
ncbi:MAG: response regulator [Chloroflexi bacterium]|nr:response regulator [Chloroflexota bacterium]